MKADRANEEYINKRLKKRKEELERIIEKKEIEIEFLNKVIEQCSEKLGYDIKQNIPKS